MFTMFPANPARPQTERPSRRELRERDLEARMSAFLAAKRTDASESLLSGVEAQRDALRRSREARHQTDR